MSRASTSDLSGPLNAADFQPVVRGADYGYGYGNYLDVLYACNAWLEARGIRYETENEMRNAERMRRSGENGRRRFK